MDTINGNIEGAHLTCLNVVYVLLADREEKNGSRIVLLANWNKDVVLLLEADCVVKGDLSCGSKEHIVKDRRIYPDRLLRNRHCKHCNRMLRDVATPAGAVRIVKNFNDARRHSPSIILVEDLDIIGGGRSVKASSLEAILKFVYQPSFEELEQRLRARKRSPPEVVVVNGSGGVKNRHNFDENISAARIQITQDAVVGRYSANSQGLSNLSWCFEKRA
ncbi:guanylate kinase 2-like protein [Tanacetum coccineum]